jgi:hypothetical protein
MERVTNFGRIDPVLHRPHRHIGRALLFPQPIGALGLAPHRLRQVRGPTKGARWKTTSQGLVQRFGQTLDRGKDQGQDNEDR